MKKISVYCEHIGLGATEPKKLASWYEQTFDLERQGHNDENQTYFLTDSKSRFLIEIFYCEIFQITNSIHFCFNVENIEIAISLLPRDVEEVSPLRQQSDGSKVYFFKDPVGHILQFSERKGF